MYMYMYMYSLWLQIAHAFRYIYGLFTSYTSSVAQDTNTAWRGGYIDGTKGLYYKTPKALDSTSTCYQYIMT